MALYPLLKIPAFAKKDFFDFNREEAKQYLDWFLNIRDERLNILEKQVKKSYSEWELNYIKSSLSLLYEWFTKHVTYRLMTEEEKEAIRKQISVTPKLVGVIPIPQETLAIETVSICSDVGVYLGEMLIRQSDLLNWTYRINSPNYIYFAQPIIMKKNSKEDFNPRASIEIIARKVLNDNLKINLFENLYEVWSNAFL
jgi:hypothetical protein